MLSIVKRENGRERWRREKRSSGRDSAAARNELREKSMEKVFFEFKPRER